MTFIKLNNPMAGTNLQVPFKQSQIEAFKINKQKLTIVLTRDLKEILEAGFFKENKNNNCTFKIYDNGFEVFSGPFTSTDLKEI